MAKPVFVTASPAPSIISGDLTLEAGAWYGHIHVRHPEVVFWQVQDTLADPDYICASTTVQGAFVFICEGNTDDEYGDPLVVTVLPQPDGSNIVTTAYYDQNYRRHRPKVWSKG